MIANRRLFPPFVVLLAAWLLPLIGHAAQLTVTWAHPTAYTDNTAIPTGAIVQTRVVWKACDSLATVDFTGAQFANVAYPTATYTITGLADGTRYCGRLRTVVTPFAESAATEWTAVTAPPPPPPPAIPNPPTDVRVTVAVVAGLNMAPVFKLTSTGKRSAEAAGFIPVGETCTGNVLFTYRSASYRKVDAPAVSWWGVVPGDAVAAPCG